MTPSPHAANHRQTDGTARRTDRRGRSTETEGRSERVTRFYKRFVSQHLAPFRRALDKPIVELRLNAALMRPQNQTRMFRRRHITTTLYCLNNSRRPLPPLLIQLCTCFITVQKALSLRVPAALHPQHTAMHQSQWLLSPATHTR